MYLKVTTYQGEDALKIKGAVVALMILVIPGSLGGNRDPVDPPRNEVQVSQTDPSFLELQAALQRSAANAPFDVAISVLDFQTGQIISVKGDQPRLLGCTINFFVLLTAARDVQQGLVDPNDVEYLITETARNSNASTSREALIQIGHGDLYEGMRRVNQTLSDLGLKAGPNPALMNHPPGYWWENLDGVFIQNSLTPNQAVQGLYRFDRSGIVSPRYRDYLLNRLEGVSPGLNYLIAASVNHDYAVVAHKNGFYYDPEHGWVDNDIGIVIFEKNGKQYVYAVAIYSQEVSQLFGDVPYDQMLLRMVWDYFDSKYQ